MVARGALSLSLSLAALSVPTDALAREFLYVPYGERAPSAGGRLSLSCDGLVAGCELQLSHWPSNRTPKELYADTSTEIALNLARARQRGEYAAFDDALILNNHYDTDGVLSVFACMQPEEALRHGTLLTEAAAAGDFGEWASERGIKLDAALEALAAGCDDEGVRYAEALERLPRLIEAVLHSDEGRHVAEEELRHVAEEELWKEGWEAAIAGREALSNGAASLELDGNVAILYEPVQGPRISAPALHAALAQLEGPPCTRVLRVAASVAHSEGSRPMYRYEYEKPGHGWCDRLVSRRIVPAADGEQLSHRLNSVLPLSRSGTAPFLKGGSSGLVSLCHTPEPVEIGVEFITCALRDLDAGCSVSALHV
eukprot:scaffold181727_cov28-Tisochrysis_lutea.AAC.1